jgi:hypothetical protein
MNPSKQVAEALSPVRIHDCITMRASAEKAING